MTDETKPPQNFTRRRILGTAAVGGAAIAGSAWASGVFGGGPAPAEGEVVIPDVLPPNLRARLAEQAAAPAVTGSIADVKHVVLLMMENRSFDHYFGAMPGVAGFSDPDAITLSTGRSVFHQPAPTDKFPDGYLLPFHMDTSTTSAQLTTSTNHNWPTQHESWNQGAMDNWLPAHYEHTAAENQDNVPTLMGYFTRADIPFHWALADAFTVCDQYHCSIMGPTAPNRVMWESGSIDTAGQVGGPILGQEGVRKEWRPYAQLLQEAGPQVPRDWRMWHLENGMRSTTDTFAAFMDVPDSAPINRRKRVVPFSDFEDACATNTLPTVSWMFPPQDSSEHPTSSTPAAGARFIYNVVNAIASHAETWASTVFILVYDENDGFFDHVVPPTPPADTPHEFVDGNSPTGIRGRGWPCGAGFRVPCIIVSPWTAGGWVCSEKFDHTSCLQFLWKVTGVKPENISQWRYDTFGDLTSAFRFGDTPAAPPASTSWPDTAAAYARAQDQIDRLPYPVAPASNQVPPVQEPGSKPKIP